MIVNRPGPQAFKTYEIVAPLTSHFRPATCEEVECRAYANGWKTTVLPGQPEHAQVLALAGRYRWTGPENNANGTVTFTFPPGQRCFRQAQHRVPLEREPLYVVRGGDARGNPLRTPAVQRRADDWVDDFANHQQAIADRVERG